MGLKGKMFMLSLNLKIITKYWLLLLVLMVMVGGVNEVKGQIYASSQTNSVTGICVLCGVTTPNNAVNQTSLTDYSQFAITVGLLGVSVEQTLIFPSINANEGCDDLVVKISSGNALLTANILGGITIDVLNGSTVIHSNLAITSSLLSLLTSGSEGEIKIRPTAKFDRVRLRLSSALVGALTNFRIHYAYTTNAIPTISVGNKDVCKGSTSTLLPYTATNSPTTYSISWNAAAVTAGFVSVTDAAINASPLSISIPGTANTGTYGGNIIVKNVNGCTSSSQSFNIIVHPKIPKPNVSLQ